MHCTQCKYIPLMFDTSRIAKFRRFRQHFLATVSLLGVWKLEAIGQHNTTDQNAGLLFHGEGNVQVFVLTFLLTLLV